VAETPFLRMGKNGNDGKVAGRVIIVNLTDVQPNKARTKSGKRKGRGHAAGQGKTAGRGEKGQKHRDTVSPGFEGGRTPLYRRLPKLRGQTNRAHNIGIFRKEHSIVNVQQLNQFRKGTTVTPQLALESGLISKLQDGLKILGDGELKKTLTVKAHAFSQSAREKIEQAGGTVEVIEP